MMKYKSQTYVNNKHKQHKYHLLSYVCLQSHLIDFHVIEYISKSLAPVNKTLSPHHVFSRYILIASPSTTILHPQSPTKKAPQRTSYEWKQVMLRT